MAALEHGVSNRAHGMPGVPTKLPFRHRMAVFLLDLPDPALQATAFQLTRSKFRLDKSFGFCLILIGCAVVEELL